MFHVGSTVVGRKAKPKARAPESWFETLSAEQLAELCSASLLSASGTKSEMIARLLASPSAEFATVGRAMRLHFSRSSPESTTMSGRPGHTAEGLKELCATAGLRSSGDRFELVVRLLRHRSGLDTGPPPKKPRVVRPDGLLAPPEPRLSRDMEKVTSRALAWCEADKSKWSNQRFKWHADDVFTKATGVLTANATGGPAHGLAVARALFKGIAAGASSVTGWGYSNAPYNAGEFADAVQKHVAALQLTVEEVRWPCNWLQMILAGPTRSPLHSCGLTWLSFPRSTRTRAARDPRVWIPSSPTSRAASQRSYRQQRPRLRLDQRLLAIRLRSDSLDLAVPYSLDEEGELDACH